MQVLTNTTKNWVKTPIVLWTIIAMLFMMTGAYVALQTNTASAGALTIVSDTLQDSDDPDVGVSAPGATVEHVFRFTTATELTTDGLADPDVEVYLNFPLDATADPFTIGAIGTGDIAIDATDCSRAFDVDSVTLTDTNTDTATKDDQIQIDLNENNQDSQPIPADCDFIITIDNAPGITNPTKSAAEGVADTYAIDIGIREDGDPSDVDSGTAMVAIIEGVTVTATVDETLSFQIGAIASGSCSVADQDNAVTTTAAAGAITVPYSTVSSDTFYDGCLDLQVGTNASGGYTVNVEKLQPLTNATADTIADGDCDGTCNATDTDTWATNTNNGFAYCMFDDPAGTTSTTPAADTPGGDWTAAEQCDDATPEFKTFPTTPTTEAIMFNAGATGSDNDIARTTYRLSVGASQEAGDYETTITYIATPTF